MTSLTLDRPQPRPLWPVFLALLVLAALAAAVAVAASSHALSKHDEAAAVVEGCNRGPHSAWQVREHPSEYWLLCQTDEGYGVRLIQCTKRGWMGRTAFIPDASQHARGSLTRAIEYLSARARQVGGKLSCP